MTPDPWCTADRHGDRAAYFTGCRCTAARKDSARYSAILLRDHILGRRRLVDSCGTARRLRALHRIGYTGDFLAARLGVTDDAVRQWRGRALVNVRTATAVRRLYDELSMTPGPSAVSVRRAIRAGWPSPLAWDDDTIDDPKARPEGVRRYAGRVDVEDVALLAGCGETWDVTALRLGVTKDGVDRVCRRAGRMDLIAQLGRNSENYHAHEPTRNQWSA